MNLWEDVYSKHKEGGRGPINPEVKPNHGLSNSLDEQMKYSASRSFEEMYYGNSRKPQAASRRVQDQEQKPRATANANQRVQNQEQEPKAPTTNQRVQDQEQPPRAQKKEVRAKYIPRRHSGTLSAPYPAILSKMNFGLSDTWSNILIGSEQDIRTLLVCGSTRKEGNTLISYHLAMFLSKEYSMKVLYVDTNLNHEPVPKIKNLPGLYSFVSEGKELASLVVQTDYPGLYLLPSGAGTIGKNLGSNMLTREPIEYLIQFCQDHFDIAVIDGQPLTLSPVMFEFAKKVDMTLLVCRFGVSRQEVSKLAVEKLISCKAKSLGVILNDRQFIVPQKLYKLLG
jgi:Mrp family chromosome partitioning ATPase